MNARKQRSAAREKRNKRKSSNEVLVVEQGKHFKRDTILQSELDLDMFKQFQKRQSTSQEECEASRDVRIRDAIEIVRKYDPFEIFAALFLANGLTDPTVYKESESISKEHLTEYVFSLVTAISEADLEWAMPDEATVHSLIALLDGIYADTKDIFFFEPDRTSNIGLREFRFQMRIRHLFMRGDSYPEHHIDLVREIGSPHDDFLCSQYGFVTQELLTTFEVIEGQIMMRLKVNADIIQEISAIQKTAFAKMVDAGDIENLSDDEFVKRLNAAVCDEDRTRVAKKSRELLKNGRELLMIDPADVRVSRNVLKACSCVFGDNKAFLVERFRGYPTNDTIIWHKPLIRIGDDFFCPSPVLTARSTLEVLEGLLMRTDYRSRYQSRRAKTLELMAVDYLKKLLPAAIVGTSVYYPIPDGGRAETDAILLFDRYVFVVEAKAGGLSLPARRGAPQRIKDDFSKIVEEAFVQGARVREFIMGRDEAIFTDEVGMPVISVKRSDVDGIFIVNPTLAALNPLGVQLGLAREKGLLSDDVQWPWCVFINDLRIVADLISSPSEFILFLNRRFATNGTSYAAHDELDLLCKFFVDGLFHEPGELKKFDRFFLHGYTDVLDQWYIGRKHGAEVKRPGLPIPLAVRALVTAIESTNRSRRSVAAYRLLELHQNGLSRIQNFLDVFRPACVVDGKPHDVTLLFRDPMPRGLSIYISREGGLPSDALQHAAIRKYMCGAKEWLAVGVCADSGRADFKFLSEIDITSDIVARAEEMSRRLLFGYVEREQRFPDRNEPCPCLSGRKFKKCCNNKIGFRGNNELLRGWR